MNYRHIVFDVDGTLLDTEQAILQSLKETLEAEAGLDRSFGELRFCLGIPGREALRQLGMEGQKQEDVFEAWAIRLKEASGLVRVFDGIAELLSHLTQKGVSLGVVTSRIRAEYEKDPAMKALAAYFPIVICAEDALKPKPDGAPLLRYMELTGAAAEEVLYIGDSIYDMACAKNAGVAGALALWGCSSVRHITADAYIPQPAGVLELLQRKEEPYGGSRWIKWAMELQFIAQAGLTYSKDRFDVERFERIRELSAEIMEQYTAMNHETVTSLFCSETGFQTPKLDTRAAVFEGDQILLVRELDGRWSLPGGWVDVNQTVGENVVKEVQEEAGLQVAAVRLIALQDRNQHNTPPYAYGICKVFMLCEEVGGQFEPNTETDASAYFGLHELPELAQEKNTKEQIEMCFAAYYDKNWKPLFD